MSARRAELRLAAARACILATASVGFGLTAVPSAEASCAGPQLALQQNGAPVTPRRVGEGLDEQLLYDVGLDRSLQVAGINLTFDCNDTIPETPGCGAPETPPVRPEQPLENAELRVSQRGHTWTLARLMVGPDLSSHLTVKLPAALRPGSARLVITDPEHGDSAELSLVLL